MRAPVSPREMVHLEITQVQREEVGCPKGLHRRQRHHMMLRTWGVIVGSRAETGDLSGVFSR